MTTEGASADRRLRLAENDIDRLTGDVKKVGEELGLQKETIGSLGEAVVAVTETVESLAKRKAAEPEPVYSWIRSVDEDVAVRELAALEKWLATVYQRYPGGRLGECWRRHDWIVEELLVLRDLYVAGWADGASPGLRIDWHRRHRPAVVEAVNDALRACGFKKHVVINPADFKPIKMVGLDDGADVARWWVTTHGQSPEPAPTRDMLQESDARRKAEMQAEHAHR